MDFSRFFTRRLCIFLGFWGGFTSKWGFYSLGSYFGGKTSSDCEFKPSFQVNWVMWFPRQKQQFFTNGDHLRQMKTVTNLFILNLAFSDVVMCLFAVPFTPLASFTGRWMFGEVLCILFPFSQGVSVYMSTLTLTIIAVDRFVVIIFPFRARMQVKDNGKVWSMYFCYSNFATSLTCLYVWAIEK